MDAVPAVYRLATFVAAGGPADVIVVVGCGLGLRLQDRVTAHRVCGDRGPAQRTVGVGRSGLDARGEAGRVVTRRYRCRPECPP